MEGRNATPRSGGRGRTRQPTSRLVYTQLGNPSESMPPGTAGAVLGSPQKSLSVKTSSSTRLKRREIEEKRQLIQLKSSFVKMKVKLEREIKDLTETVLECEDAAKICDPSETEAREEAKKNLKELQVKLHVTQQELKRKQQDLADLIGTYEIEKEELEQEAEADKLEILVDEEESQDQHLDSDEEALIRRWDENQEVGQPLIPGDPPKLDVRATELHPAARPNLGPHSVELQDDDDRTSVTSAGSNFEDKIDKLAETLANGFTFKGDKKLPEFNGDLAKYGMFIALYKMSTKKHKISDDENLHRLSVALKGEARNLVEHLFTTGGNVPIILDKLKRRFGRPEQIIGHLIDKAKACKPPDKNPRSLMEYGNIVEVLVTNINAYKRPEYLQNPQLVTELVSKLPENLKAGWYKHLVRQGKENESLSDFHLWLDTSVQAAERMVTFNYSTGGKKEETRPTSSARSRGSFGAAVEVEKCLFCSKPKHTLPKCFEFKRMTVLDRKDFLVENKCCFLCLQQGHLSTKCTSHEKTCGKDGCKLRHHALLHQPDREKIHKTNVRSQKYDDQTPSTSAEANQDIGSWQTTGSSDNLPVVQVMVRGPNGSFPVHALFDSGASFSMIDEKLAAQIGLSGERETFNFKVFGDVRRETSMRLDLEVSPSTGKRHYYPVKGVRTVKNLGLPARTFDAQSFKQKYPHLREMKAVSCDNAKPQMVLGSNVGTLFAAREILEAAPGETPAAVRSLLGWYAVYDTKDVRNHFHAVMQYQEAQDELQQTVTNFFLMDSIGIQTAKNLRSQEDSRALSILEATTIKVEGRFETGLLWKYDSDIPGNSKRTALQRLRSMERRMDRDAIMAQLCVERFDEYLRKGYLKLIVPEVPVARKWYLPWFFAYHPSKKPRLVFDGAAKSEGKSLNDFLLKGPDLLQKLEEVLMRFRVHKIALIADVKEMFHQVKLREDDQPSQTILYRGMEREAPPEEYQMTVLFFGSTSSPCSAIYTKNVNAKQFEEHLPQAVQAIEEDMYVDDFLGGGESEAEVSKLQQDMCHIMESGGFPLVKWNSSSSEVLSQIPEDKLAPSVVKQFSDKNSQYEVEKTLGLNLDLNYDKFSFDTNFSKIHPSVKNGSRRPTKREMLSLVMSVFDPLGFLAPLKMKALTIVQQVWRSPTRIGWDDEIPISVIPLWNEWLRELEKVNTLEVPRRLWTSEKKDILDIQLHVFCDASCEAYAAAAYFRVKSVASVEVTFVYGKSRVAPVKGFASVPRAELQAALIGTRIAEKVISAHNGRLKISRTVYWSDASIVLSWIRSTNKAFRTFESNRLSEIWESSKTEEWRWVPSHLNVADDATRSSKSCEFDNYRWINCDPFLLRDEVDWPVEEACDDSENVSSAADMPAPRLTDSLNWIGRCELTVLPSYHRFSSWFRLVRATALLVALGRRVRKIGPGRITLQDMDTARSLLIRASQNESFPEEVRALESGKSVSSSSRLYRLSPVMNKSGIIVVSGRLENASTDLNVKTPPILCPKSHYTKIMISWFHQKGKHFGQEKLVADLRMLAWILDCRAAVKRCFSKCVLCQVREARARPPLMGQLPVARTESGRPVFHNTMVDYFGPLFVKVLRSTPKRWGVIFNCMASRAVHLELSDSLDTHDMIDAFVRFASLRGKPSHLWSDNGTNFVGAEKEMRLGMQAWQQEKITGVLAVIGVEWHFGIPGAPHMNGTVERMVGLVKKVMFKEMKVQPLRESTLRTLFAEVANILNSRPLTFVSNDPCDDDCITPNHLLNLPSVIGPTVPSDMDKSDLLRKSFKQAQYLADLFWKKWSARYLPWLIKRRKWWQPQTPLQVGELVVVLEDNALRNEWKKGIIDEVSVARDGQTRSVIVKVMKADPDKKGNFKTSYLRRPTVKVCKLDVL